ncbi:MAG: cysteine--tRNA ligase [Candidatus Micrarchaeota archaeon]|nr:cysteine--tRNA ligase [Candidatus Micrarchaeota archaeon]MDE1833716.1 cysteine--tRNA ligase [Candidatus Micrarchaeota archaeon]MDE1859840.1 cysteine--tRNA ligase [Candidatus Micrarchaeota archaeon]
MALVIYNTLSRSKEEFVPIKGRSVKMFVCGQTVYDDAHLGHAKNYINFDIIARWLKHSGYNLKYIQNITDIDDKIIKRAEEVGKEPIALAREYEARFMEDMEAIGVRRNVTEYPRSHDYIEDITLQIQLLADKGFAYALDADIYYDVSIFPDYTKLSGMKIDELEKHRIEPKEGKRNSYDFALWKGSKPGDPAWEIEIAFNGKKKKFNGRPGWHIEDTAITYAIFGKQYDIHGGAIELIFPHHTNEIAQAQAAFGVKPYVRYWMHTGIMLIKGEKMSKSLKNFIRIRDLLKAYDPEALRLLVASTHYRKDMAYTEELMKKAAARLGYMRASLSIFYNMRVHDAGRESVVTNKIDGMKSEFEDAMNDDLNTPLALTSLASAIDSLRSYAESNSSIDKETKEYALNSVIENANVLGILENPAYKEKIPDDAKKLIKEREKLRADKKFDAADSIRNRIRDEYSITLEDSEYGTIWYIQK